MRVILRNTETGMFYAGPATWSHDAAQAQDFRDTALALDAAASIRLEHVEVVMSFADPQFEIPLTVVSLGG